MNVSSSAMRLEANTVSTTRVAASAGGSCNLLLNNQKLYNHQQLLLTQRRRVKVLTVCCSTAKPVDALVDQQKQANDSAAMSRINSLSQVSGVLGSQWGDEGKGKLVDILAKHFDVVARCQVPVFNYMFRNWFFAS